MLGKYNTLKAIFKVKYDLGRTLSFKWLNPKLPPTLKMSLII